VGGAICLVTKKLKDMKNQAYRNLLSSGNYITLNKSLIRSLGLIEAVYLGALIDKHNLVASESTAEEDAPFKCSQTAITGRVLLSAHQQMESLKKLKKLGIITVIKKGVPPTNYFDINYVEIVNLINKPLVQSSNPQSIKALTHRASKLEPTEQYIYKETLIKRNSKKEEAAAAVDKPKNSGIKNNSGIRLSSISEKVSRDSRVASLTDDEKVVLKEYKKLIFKNCSEKTPAVIEHLPGSVKIFKQYYPENYVAKFVEALNNFANDEWCRSLKLDMKKKAMLSPSRFLKPKFIENNILPYVSDNPIVDGNSSKNRYTEEELREVEEFNRESTRKWKEKNAKIEERDRRMREM
jgi:hypothetical protein